LRLIRKSRPQGCGESYQSRGSRKSDIEMMDETDTNPTTSILSSIPSDTPFTMMEGRLKVIYKITYPNGKIYIGQDRVASMRYFGSPDRKTLAADFTLEDYSDFTVRRQILWESETATNAEVTAKEVELIRLHRANDPKIGYNRWPKFESAQ
jgi:hypothetical protein